MKMSNLKLLGVLPAACVICAGSVQADTGWYTGISGDLTWLSHSKMGGGFNVDLGYRLDPNVRVEGEFGYHNAAGDSGYSDTYYFTYMANGYYDFNQYSVSTNGMHITPYLGAGIGIANYRFGQSNLANTFHHHNTDFAYQGMAGLNLVADSMPNVDWVLGYRYTGAGGDDIEANNLEVGLRYHF